MTDPTITPASDEEISKLRAFLARERFYCFDCGCTNPEACKVVTPKLIARIEADRATIAKQAKEIERLRGSLAALVRMHFHPDGRPYEMPAHEMRVVEDARSALSKPDGR